MALQKVRRFFGALSYGVLFGEREFQKQMRVRPSTFQYLCNLLGPVLRNKNTKLRKSITIECRVAVTLSQLATRNILTMTGDLFGIGLNTTSVIVRECCEAIRIYLQPLAFKKAILAVMRGIAWGFETLHGIPLILGAIDGSHIHILAPS